MIVVDVNVLGDLLIPGQYTVAAENLSQADAQRAAQRFLSGFWSRRIIDEHRLVYSAEGLYCFL